MTTIAEEEPRLAQILMGVSVKLEGDAEQVAEGQHYDHPSQVPGHIKKYEFTFIQIKSKILVLIIG